MSRRWSLFSERARPSNWMGERPVEELASVIEGLVHLQEP